jgi:hypothetical protein
MLMADLGPIALAEVIRRSGEQQQTLTATRTAAGTILSASTLGAAFLAAIALEGADDVVCIVWFAIAATAATAIVALLPLLPLNVGIITDPETLDRPEWAVHTDNDAAMHLVRYIAKRADANAARLDQRWRFVIAAGVLTTTSILLWIVAVIVRYA